MTIGSLAYRNEVRNTRLVDAKVWEAWREAGSDHATVAVRYGSVDVMHDRVTAITKLWMFIRTHGAVSKLSFIQGV